MHSLFTATPDILNTVPDEHILLELIANIDDKWHEIGLSLNLPRNVLNHLKQRQDSNIIKLSEVIHTWLTTQSLPVTWKTIITAIKGGFVKNKEKADEICKHLGLPMSQ